MNQPQSKSGSKNYIIGIIIIALIIIGVSFAGGKGGKNENADTEKSATETASTATGENVAGALEVVYSDENGFTPDSLTVKMGDTVKFVNKSTGAMWVGADEHPTHMEYDGTSLREHCTASATPSFDQCGDGKEYSFTFTKAGSWDYHNHMRPRMAGTIIVK